MIAQIPKLLVFHLSATRYQWFHRTNWSVISAFLLALLLETPFFDLLFKKHRITRLELLHIQVPLIICSFPLFDATYPPFQFRSDAWTSFA
jgi:hypothetical protein